MHVNLHKYDNLYAYQDLLDLLYKLGCVNFKQYNTFSILIENKDWDAMSDPQKDRFMRGH